MQSTLAHAGILTDFLDGPVQNAAKAVDNLINSALDKVQKAADNAQGNLDEFVKKQQEWASDKTKVHDSLKEISEKVSVVFLA